ncbi:PAS domain S-box protein [Sphingomonas radiodurans]|uniref:PAS domain S-box protein n=1 Tax=Sphingomonas radiodurans TaxID=2890321 RepID=UPI001E4D8032|nr:PAS domain S-box protein [Sphingomonas radiodurans]WBH15128.1 PAS domain S-box protein [Sphingomonas radiodurans]
MNLVGDGRQFFKAEVGLGVRETPLETSFCAKALIEEEFLLVPDATLDPRFACNPLVTSEPHIRFYAGALLKTEDGLPIGTLCVLDYRPRDLTQLQQDTMHVLARQVMAQLELRRAVRERDSRYELARASEERLRLILDSARDYAIMTMDADRRITSWSAGAKTAFGWSEQDAFGRPIDDIFTLEDREAGVPQSEIAMAAAEGCASDIRWHLRADGSRVFMNGSTHPIVDGDGGRTGFLKIARNETRDREQVEELARTRTELIDSEARFRNMADHAPLMMWVTEPDGYCSYLNRRWYEFTGQTEEDALGLGWTKATHPDDEKMAGDAFLAACAAQAPFRVEYRLRRADGTYRWAIDAAAPRFAEDGSFLGHVGSVIDIDDRREAEDALRQANALLAAVMEAVPGVVYAKDRDGRMLAANRGTSELVGKPLEDVIGRTDLEFLDDPTQALEVMANDQRVMAQNRIEALEEVISLADGTGATWLSTKAPFRDAKGEVVGLVGSSIDISERKRAEEALRRFNETLEEQIEERSAALRLYRNIVQSDTAAVCAFDTEYRLIAFNQAHSDEFFRIYGHRVEIGEVFPDLFLPHQAQIMRDFMTRALAGEVFTVTQEFGDPDLAVPHWEVTYNPLRVEDGRVIGAFHHAIDITERLRAQADLAATQEALRQSQKMEAVGQLTGGLAHDFNNLLTGIMGNLELLQHRVARGRLDDLDRLVNAAQGASRRAASLTQRLLAFSRRQTLDPKPTDVNRLIAGMEDLLRRTVGATTDVEIVGAAGLWNAMIDPGQLENALLNLCINARDAMPYGGKITIETANKWLDDRTARERDLPPGQYLSICVTDTGTGMTPETVRRAFEPFFTTKPIGQGTGLGLSMIYGFARQSGGQVRIYSEVGQGTTMCIYLPRHLGDAAAEEDASAVLSANEGHGETILVVDDEATIRHLIDEVLDELGYTVIGAADGAAGLKVLQSGARIELLITDVGLPNGMNGRQVADAARAIRPDLKVLFITGYAENAAVGNGHLEPGMELLTKPFSLDDLTRKVRGMLGVV